MDGQGKAQPAPVPSPACEGGGTPADVDEMWRAIGAAAALIGLSGGGRDLIAGALAESVAGHAALADGIVGCLALLESEYAAPGASEAQRIYAGVLRWRNGGDYDRSDDASHILDAAKQVDVRLGGGPRTGEAALVVLNHWRQAA